MDWGAVLVAVIAAIPPTIVSWENHRKLKEVDRKVEAVHQCLDRKDG